MKASAQALALGLCAFITGFSQARADYLAPTVLLTRKLVVFPFKTESVLQPAAEQSWWRARELLTEKKRFLVASKQFLLQKEVFQPRGELRRDDVTLLGSILDADALITGECMGRTFILRAYEAKTGRLLFNKRLSFHPSLRATEQIQVVSERLTQDMVATIPYQAFVVKDSLIGKPVYPKDDKNLALVNPGSTEDLVPGMDVQFIQLAEKSPDKPLFQGGAETEVVAEGKIREIKNGLVELEITRTKDLSLIKENSLVRIPREAQRVSENYGLAEEHMTVVSDPLPTLINPSAPESHEARKRATVAGSFVSLLAIILMAL